MDVAREWLHEGRTAVFAIIASSWEGENNGLMTDMSMPNGLFPARIFNHAGMGTTVWAYPFFGLFNRDKEFGTGIVFNGTMKRDFFRKSVDKIVHFFRQCNDLLYFNLM